MHGDWGLPAKVFPLERRSIPGLETASETELFYGGKREQRRLGTEANHTFVWQGGEA